MKKILITGASGFVGSFLVEEALRRNLEVHAGIRRSSSREFLQDERLHFLELDFSSKEKMTEQLGKERFDYIVHNAGVVSAPKLEDYWRVNFEYAKNFADALVVADAVPEKFTFISSLAAYGPASQTDLNDFLTENRTPTPINAYGKAKLSAERHLMQLPDFPYIIIRPTAVYGPREREILTFFKLINRRLEGYIGSGEQRLTFIYVKDLVRLILDATLSEHSRKAYFISDGRQYSQEDLGRISKRILQKSTLPVHVPVALVRSIARLLEQIGRLTSSYPALNLEKVHILSSRNWQCDTEPLRRDFDFQPQYDLEKGLTETLAWYKTNGWL